MILILLMFSCASSLDTSTRAADPQMPARGLSVSIDDIEFVASPSLVYVGEEVTFFANASSSVGAELTFLIYFEYYTSAYQNNTYSPSYVTTSESPGNIVVTHTYDEIGNLSAALGTYFRVRLYVGDGENTVYKGISVYVIDNSAPTIPLRLPEAIERTYGLEYSFSTTVKDVDDDPLVVTWDFGDGTDPVQNLTGPAAAGVVCNQTHAWLFAITPEQLGTTVTLWLNLTVEDGHDHVTKSATRVLLLIPWNLSPERTFAASTYSAAPNQTVELYASASDYEGDAMTWTFVFNNSYENYLTEVYYTESTPPETLLWVNTTHAFTEVGNYTVTLFISDVEVVENQVYPHNISAKVRISVTITSPPNALDNITKHPHDAYLNDTTETCLVILSIEANDPDGDVITATWDFGDGSDPAANVSGGGRQTYVFKQPHVYTSAGFFSVSLVISDGVYEIFRSTNITIRSNNTAPEFVSLAVRMSNGNFALPNSSVNFTITLRDAERDPIELIWDFGDSTPAQKFNLTEFDEDGNVSMSLSHSFASIRTYNVTMTFTDHKFDTAYHNSSRVAIVKVSTPRIVPEIVWDWWDYTSLGIVLSIFAGVGIWTAHVQRLRRQLDLKGMTYEEYKMTKNEQTAGGPPDGREPL